MAGTILMIHGMFCHGRLWDNYRNYFEGRGYRVVTPTLRHHDIDPLAAPPPDLGTTSLLDYADDLEAEIAGLDEEPILMGHSMGGLLALILAARGHGRAAALLTPAAPWGIVALTPSVLRTFAAPLLTWGFWRRPFRLSYAAARYGGLNTMTEKQARQTHATLVHESGRAMAEIAFWPLDRRRATEAAPEGIACPLLVVAGGRDRMTPAPVVRRVARKYAAHVTAYREFPACGHWVISEPRWEEVADACAKWLTGIDGREAQ